MIARLPSDLTAWLEARRKASRAAHRRIDLSASSRWRYVEGRIAHDTGGFFSVVGLRAASSAPPLDGLEQPIILQPEIGILGFLVRRSRGRPEILVQAKAEPGNVGSVQLAPTVQATESNYLMRHGGAPTAYLEYFTGRVAGTETLADCLQSEQGTRFLGKYNRNVSVLVAGDGPAPVSDVWRWIDAEMLRAHLAADFAVNTDARSTLLCSDWSVLASAARPFARWRGKGGFGAALLEAWDLGAAADASTAEICARLEALRARIRIDTSLRPLDALRGWTMSDGAVSDTNGAGFDVAFFDVRCEDREVTRWDQPLLASREEADVVLLCQRRRGLLHFLLRGSAEIGFTERVQLGPTAQTGMPWTGAADLRTFALSEDAGTTHADVRQSDEGGRFYRTVVRYRIREVPEGSAVPEDPMATWVTLGQVHALTRRKGLLTNEARSVLSLLLPWL
jgi:dTDP-4-dehydro-6-deoxy-alpha-D-glucopyranose 2,3-dehydratase